MIKLNNFIMKEYHNYFITVCQEKKSLRSQALFSLCMVNQWFSIHSLTLVFAIL